ncbi:MAG: aminopeptidase P family protein [Dehalococcoidia bacterium]
METRLKRLRGKLEEKGLDALLVSQPENRRYLSGFTGSAGYLLISQEHAFIATDFRYFQQVERQSSHFQLVKILQGSLRGWLPDVLSQMKPRRLAFEAHHLSFALYQQLAHVVRHMAPSVRPRLMATAELVESLRAIKDPEELKAIEKAVQIADAAMMEVAPALEPGMSEREVAWRMEAAMREQGADKVSFDTIVAAGPNAALPHHHPSERPIERGEPVVIDMGAQVDGYCSDITRTFCLGSPDDTFKRIYDTVLAAQLAAMEAVGTGMSGHQADALARSVIEGAGYGENFGHSLGHGIGLAVHEQPRLGMNSSVTLEKNMVFTIEPGIYLPDWGGVRIEDMVILGDERAKGLTKSPKKDGWEG